jgi:hypothetical protein
MRLRLVLVAAGLTLLACGSSAAAPRRASGTVSGRVLSAPSCPVERAGSPCPPRPVVGATVVALRASHVVASTHTGANGHYVLHLTPGHYLIRATNPGIGSTAQHPASVRPGETTTVRLVVDSGIR